MRTDIFEVIFTTKDNQELNPQEYPWVGYLTKYVQVGPDLVSLTFNVNPEILDKQDSLFNNLLYFTLNVGNEDSKILVTKKYMIQSVQVNYEKSNIMFSYTPEDTCKITFDIYCKLIKSDSCNNI